MPVPSFTIATDPDRDLVRIRMAGFFGVADVDRFESALRMAHDRLRCAPRGGPLTLNDIGGMAIQSRDVAQRWAAFLANPAHRSRRLAFVVGSALARIQLQRLLNGRSAEVFTDAGDAERWLFAPALAGQDRSLAGRARTA